MKRGLSLLLAWAAAIGVLVPMLISAKDDFPFSNYPMFTADRRKVDLTVMLHSESEASVLQGERVPPDWISGQEVIMAMTTLMRASWQGPPGMTRLCDEVRTVARERGQALQALAFVIETMDVLAQVQGEEIPHQRRVLFMCPRPKVVQ